MRQPRVIQHLLLLGLLASGCERSIPLPDDVAERYAAALCAAEAACGCQQYSSIDECEADVIAAFERVSVVSNVDEGCFENLLTALDNQGCVSAIDFQFSCSAVVGTTPVGEACEGDPRLAAVMPGGTCEADAYCSRSTGVCIRGASTSAMKELGDPCKPHHPPSCGLDLYCASDSRCAPRTATGEACSDPYECEVGSFCPMDTGMCTPELALGESCNPDDARPCDWAMTSPTMSETTWCSPETEVCEVDVPFVCWQLDYPFPP